MKAQASGSLPGWGQLRHGGLLFDEARLQVLADFVPGDLYEYKSQKLRQLAHGILEGGDSRNRSRFVIYVMEVVCGLDGMTGRWERGNNVAPTWSRRTSTGELVRPNHIWRGLRGGLLPVFIDEARRLGVGRGRRAISRSLGWLRAGDNSLALLTNGHQWRLLFAGLDHEAWCEWDLELWFEGGELSTQVTALRTLLQSCVLEPTQQGSDPPLIKLVRDSRKGQADLSEALGERVRQAVEILIQGHGDVLRELDDSVVEMADIYRAACRIAMRLVVILFAESRELLPIDNSLYNESYGLNGLAEQLKRRSNHKYALTDTYAAWPRLLALFKLIHEGSHHPDLPITRYGGGLFAPGNPDSKQGIGVALQVFECSCFTRPILPDQDILEILRLLTRTSMRIRQGRGSSPVEVPVDFSNLSSEYIGVLYEGLLDYELKTAPPDTPVIFLAVGQQPAIPLSTLEGMPDNALKALFKKSVKVDGVMGESASRTEGEGSTDHADSLLESSESTDQESDGAADGAAVGVALDDRQRERIRAERWAQRAALAAGLVPHRHGQRNLDRKRSRELDLKLETKHLIGRVILPREWYLVRWGGTRKGSGSFYTRPGLAIPTVQRTLRPLAFDPLKVSSKSTDADVPTVEWVPKTPEQILDLTVCDPASGSGTFPVAALRFLTNALYESLHHHNRIRTDGDRTVVRLLRSSHLDASDCENLADEFIPCPIDHEEFESQLKATLRRHVIERCIYAVDIDPLAVELCRLSLWIETMDRNLPFGFIDHKIKRGNSLIGAWYDQFLHYPVMAWKNRDAGDTSHTNGVHYQKGSRTKAIKEFVTAKLKPDLKSFLEGKTLFQEDLLRRATDTHRTTLGILNSMHSLPVHHSAVRSQMYNTKITGSQSWRTLKATMDMWCACWFWPVEAIKHAPLPTNFSAPPEQTQSIATQLSEKIGFFHWELEFPDVFQSGSDGFDAILGNPPWDVAKPASKEFFSNIDPLYNSYGKQDALRHQTVYFEDSNIEEQWLEYRARFRAQSNFFSFAFNPFGDPKQHCNSRYRFSIVGGQKNRLRHKRWRDARESRIGFADSSHPYQKQGGGDSNLYKLFLELAHALLKSPSNSTCRQSSSGGRLGFIVPSGLYSDQATQKLRDTFIQKCRWEWLFGIDNREGIFPIHRSQKFCAVIIQKGGFTDRIHTRFMCNQLSQWEHMRTSYTYYLSNHVRRFSPHTHAILEVRSQRDLEILETIFASGLFLNEVKDNCWNFTYVCEFHSTNDSNLFSPRPEWEASGYIPDEYSRWIRGPWREISELWRVLGYDRLDATQFPVQLLLSSQELHGGYPLETFDVVDTDCELRVDRHPYDRLVVPRARIPCGIILSRNGEAWIREEDVEHIALPVYEGRMIGQSEYSRKRWISGKGRGAQWEFIPWHDKHIEPQFLMDQRIYWSRMASPFQPKCSHMRVASATNRRTAISTLVFGMPTDDTAATFTSKDIVSTLVLNGVLNSLVFDYLTRMRLVGLHLDYHVLQQNPLPDIDESIAYRGVVQAVARLNLSAPLFAPYFLSLLGHEIHQNMRVALTRSERCRLTAIVDALVAICYRMSRDDMLKIIEDCDFPVVALRSAHIRSSLDPKGFWRVDSELDPELRQTVLSFVAFCDLELKIRTLQCDREAGIHAFVDQNDGQGWMIPDYICLAEFGLGRDEHAQRRQAVARRLGPRFYDWQVEQSTDDFWSECHVHSRNVLGESAYAMAIADISSRCSATAEDYSRYIANAFVEGRLSRQGCFSVLRELVGRAACQSDVVLAIGKDLLSRRCLDAQLYEELCEMVREVSRASGSQGARSNQQLQSDPSPDGTLGGLFEML